MNINTFTTIDRNELLNAITLFQGSQIIAIEPNNFNGLDFVTSTDKPYLPANDNRSAWSGVRIAITEEDRIDIFKFERGGGSGDHTQIVGQTNSTVISAIIASLIG